MSRALVVAGLSLLLALVFGGGAALTVILWFGQPTTNCAVVQAAGTTSC